MKVRHSLFMIATSALVTSCSTTASTSTSKPEPSTMSVEAQPSTTVYATASTVVSSSIATTKKTTFTAEVWADNWFSLYINGVLVGQDSVPITTEKSFNSETITFSASYPFTIGMVTKDFKQNDSGLEYIGTDRQQMGDGGFIAQFTDTSTGKTIAYTDSTWHGFVVHQAPLNVSCEKSAIPDTECTSKISGEPANWSQVDFDDSSWPSASAYTENEVGVKDGYNNISWVSQAKLIWTSSLTIDNTILWRYTVSG